MKDEVSLARQGATVLGAGQPACDLMSPNSPGSDDPMRGIAPRLSLKELAHRWSVAESTASRRIRRHGVPRIKEGKAASARVFLEVSQVRRLEMEWGWYPAKETRSCERGTVV